jgi:hypothetical protein
MAAEESVTRVRIPFSTVAEKGGRAVETGKPFRSGPTMLAERLSSGACTMPLTAVGRICAEQHRARVASNRADFIVLNTSTSEYITRSPKTVFCGVLQRGERTRYGYDLLELTKDRKKLFSL